MPKIKTVKSIAKRFKITKTGKLMKKKAGQGHFNSREKGSVTRAKRLPKNTSESMAKPLKVMMPYAK